MEIAPVSAVEGIDEAAGGILPMDGARGLGGVPCGAVEIFGLGIVIGIAGKDLRVAIDVKLVERLEPGWCAGLEDAWAPGNRRPLELEGACAAQDRRTGILGAPDDGAGGVAIHVTGEHERFVELVGAVEEDDSEVALAGGF